ncbi:phage tail assembly chaperone [Halovulum dunhuangense]|uniref:Phage tail assembly chaperone n=1 Tax=Halovulum dunhuangense TaxID=1505036 RepID=A0A849L768_9RHOB|nr:rcc01693 family protein [Halovulum dunhuangense]NNU81911.1 phage tail assembly chaperone [Halovulum dunhuangense]
MSGVDWPRLMRLGLVELGLAPDAFWALTPAELMLMAGGGAGGAGAMTRAGLDALARIYPDGSRGERHDGG